MVQYVLECIAFQLVFLIIYDLFLKRETFFQWNRAYLIGTYVLSIALPWIKIEALKSSAPQVFQSYPEFLWNSNDAAVAASVTAESSLRISWEYTILFGGMFLATLFFGCKLYQIYALRQKGEVHYFKDFTRIIVSNSSIAFSFFKSIFLGDMVVKKKHQGIVQHELVHIRQRHTYDLIFFELMRIVGWFNPLVYVYQSRVSELHEFIADAQVAKTHKREQYELLLAQVFQTQHISFINQFFKSSLIKKRIVMLQKARSKKILQLKYLLLVPLVFGMLAYTSIEAQEKEIIIHKQTPEDEVLIAEIESEIDREIRKYGTIDDVFQMFVKSTVHEDFSILTKRQYFKEKILYRYKLADFYVQFGDDVKPRKSLPKAPLPSTALYEDYVQYTQAFQTLDNNLTFSITKNRDNEGYGVRPIEKGKELSFEKLYIFKVENVKDLTGIEVRSFNRTLEEVLHSNSDYSGILIEDEKYAFQIFRTEKTNNVTNKSSSKSNTSNDRNTREATTLYNYNQLLKERKRLLKSSNENNPIIVNLDRQIATLEKEIFSDSETIPFAKVDKVPVFPGCEDDKDQRACFQKSIMRHISKNFRYPEEAQKQGLQGKVAIMFTMNTEGDISNVKVRGPHKLLEDEAARIISKLPKLKPGIHEGEEVNVAFSIPITFKLDSDGSDYEMLPENYHPDEKVMKTVRQYNQLLNERNRLLKNSNKQNPIIVNLDQQLNGLRESLTDQLLSNTDKNKTVQKDQDSDIDIVPFGIVEEVPIFPGCEDDTNKRSCFNSMMQKHISKNFRYPEEAQEKGIQGRVSIMFTVSKEGSIQNVRMRGPDKLLEKEAGRIISLLPKMIPGKQKGKPVNVPYSIPISFKLQGEKDIFPLDFSDALAPLVIIDGIESTSEALKKIETSNIGEINILKDEAAIKKYGDKGKNGVIMVKTKKN